MWEIQRQGQGRAAECLCLWQRQEEGQHKDAQGRFVRTCSHDDTVLMSLGVTQGASPRPHRTHEAAAPTAEPQMLTCHIGVML